MNDVFLRALRHPLDYIGGLRSRTASFIESHDLGNNVRAFDFSIPTGLTWKAGQHAIFTLPDKQVAGKKWRVFSIASSPKEGFVRIATTFPPQPSDFKQKLMTLQPGDNITIRGPLGEMHTTSPTQTIIGIAGGIGFTPFRALLAEFKAGLHPNCTLELIYAGKEEYYPFEYECRDFANLNNVTVHFVNTPKEVNATIDHLVAEYKNTATYFISGSPGMITAIKKRLRDATIRDIVSDPFKGY